ncbi:MAG: hypothetical protein CR981_03735 [Proteobacteria bacterium]|nr:MAG: hypothetical protein CR981_03735 [Pseudomonadota bacterium]
MLYCLFAVDFMFFSALYNRYGHVTAGIIVNDHHLFCKTTAIMVGCFEEEGVVRLLLLTYSISRIEEEERGQTIGVFCCRKVRLHKKEDPVQIVKVSIMVDQELVEAVSDFMVGILDMVVECEAGDDGKEQRAVHGFTAAETITDKEVEVLAGRISSFLAEMAVLFQVKQPGVVVEFIPDQDWLKKWKLFFQPLELVPGLVVAPSWEHYEAKKGEEVLTIDPGMAFGTGHHATTRLCLELIGASIDYFAGRRVLDVGTGTGLLAMAAARWGAKTVCAIDHDPEAVQVASGNIRTNKLSRLVSVSGNDLDASVSPPFDLVVANIIHDTLVEMAGSLTAAVVEGGRLILSGLMAGEQLENIVTVYSAEGFRLLTERQEGVWSAVILEKTCGLVP